MHGYVKREQEELLIKCLKAFPCVALLGARQVGKSTLAKKILQQFKNSIYLDLQDPRDLAQLQNPMDFLEANKNSLICIDEIQRLPEVFSVFRAYLDSQKKNTQLLLLGSASRDLIRQSSETLAGRISYIEITGFSAAEVFDHNKLWLQGGYPSSYLVEEEISLIWRKNYIRTFLERDIPQLGFSIPAITLQRFWTMLAHLNGSILNQSKLASSMGVSSPSIKSYIDILEATFVIRRLNAFHSNTKKRLIKSPKIYIRDTGLIHSLLNINNYNELLGHPALGNSYEAFVINSLVEKFPDFQTSFFSSAGGAEIDLILQKGLKIIAIEIKSSSNPSVTKGFYESLKTIQPTKSFVVAPVKKDFPLSENIWVYNLSSVLKMKL